MLTTNFVRQRLVRSSANKRMASTFKPKDLMRKYKVGGNVEGFVVEQVQSVPEFSLVAVLLRHERVGAYHLHLDSPYDRNNVFLVAFKTNPPDSTGVPHILEHITLCGSHKYPVRDPFFKMLNRSLSNFMNAMTAHDFTYYPFATTNARDFDNLMDVYLSSVFEPLLNFEDFSQEGWRLENSDIYDNKSPLEFKGVVYNEMKGQYANSAYYFWIKFQEAIYSSLHNSGGDPNKITDLMYEDLIEFHSKNYHPSNSRTFTYGSLPLAAHLSKLDKAFLPFGARGQRNEIRMPNIVLDPNGKTNIVVPGPVDVMTGSPIEEQYKASITWHLGNPLEEKNHYLLFKWKIMSSLLVDGISSPFYHELIEKEYGDDFSVNTGLDNTTALFSFSVGLSNLSESKAESLEEKIYQVINNTVLPELRKGKQSQYNERVEAILHQIELSFRKHKPDLGLGLLNSIIPGWVNGVNPITLLKMEDMITEFKKEFESNGISIFEELLVQTILNPETKKFKFTMKPVENFSKNASVEESKRLEEKLKKLSDEDKQILYERSLTLADRQKAHEDISVLPTLGIHDIPRTGEFYRLDFSSVNSKKIQKRIVASNGLIYMNAIKDLSYMPMKFYKYLPLFSACLTSLAGTSKSTITDLEARIQKYTGGLLFNTSVKTDPCDVNKTRVKFLISSMSLGSNSPKIYDLLYEILVDTRFDLHDEEITDKLAALIKGISQNQMNLIIERGHSYANFNSSAQLSSSKHISNILNGIEQINFIATMGRRLELEGKEFLASEVLPVFQELREKLLNCYTEGTDGGFEYSLVGDKGLVAMNEDLIGKFDSKISASVDKHGRENILLTFVEKFNQDKIKNLESIKAFIDLPVQTSFSSLAKPGAAYDSDEGAALQILAQLATFKHLHSVIREANGAYGGGISYDGLGGILNFYSYRDPNPLASLKSFKDTYRVLMEKLTGSESTRWTYKDLEEAKLAIFQSIDAPISISSQGSSTFLEQIDDEMRQRRRERFLDTGFDDLELAAQKYLLNPEEAITLIGNTNDVKLDTKAGWKIENYA